MSTGESNAMPAARQCLGDRHVSDGRGGCQCGNLYARNSLPAGAQGETPAEECPNCGSMFDSENEQAEEIARLREMLSDQKENAAQWMREETIERDRAVRAESQVQALQAQLSEAQRRIETLTAERDEAVAAEREACARVADDSLRDEEYGHAAFRCVLIAQRIRERGVTAAPQEDQP